MADASRRIADATASAERSISGAQAEIREISQLLRTTTETTAQQWRDYEQRFKDVDDSLGLVLDRIIQSVQDNLEALRSFVERIDEKLSGAVDKLGGGIDELGEFAQSMEQLTIKLIEAIFIEGHADSDVYNPRTGTAVAPPATPPSDDGILGFLKKKTTPSSPAQTAPARRLGPPKDNLDLSTLRATSTFRELRRVKQELGLYLNPNNKPVLSVSGYGEYRQVKREPNETDEAYKQRNRRIDLRILMATPRSEDAKQMQQDLQRLESRP